MKSTLLSLVLLVMTNACFTAAAQDAPSSSGDTSASAGAAAGATQSSQASSLGQVGDGGSPLDLPVTTDQSLLFPQSSNQVIQPGDMIGISVYGESALAPAVRVDSNGDVQLPFLHEVHIAGLSIQQAEDYLAQRLVEAQLFVNPQVTISITETTTNMVAFIGDLHARVPVYGSRRLIDVLGYAGGLPTTASHTLVISRRGVPQPIVVDLGNNPILSPAGQTLILPGDVISVQRAGTIYVLGQFRNTGSYPLTGSENTTLLQMASRLGDPNFSAKPHELRLIRTTNGVRHFVVVDYKGIVEGKKPDPILQAGDILYMPTSGFKAAVTSGGLTVGLNFVNLALLAYQLTRY